MTAPDWVPFMRKAAAVVTDSGGMTCHAAIVSWPSATAALVDQAQRSLDEIDGVKGIAVAGGPREELTKLAEDVDLLIVGSRGCGPRACVLNGSLSSYLERHVSSALLIVPRGPAQTAAGDPADGHELAEVAVPAGAPLR
jgi:nucleotide-binding universal stress UspA family protein